MNEQNDYERDFRPNSPYGESIKRSKKLREIKQSCHLKTIEYREDTVPVTSISSCSYLFDFRSEYNWTDEENWRKNDVPKNSQPVTSSIIFPNIPNHGESDVKQKGFWSMSPYGYGVLIEKRMKKSKSKKHYPSTKTDEYNKEIELSDEQLNVKEKDRFEITRENDLKIEKKYRSETMEETKEELNQIKAENIHFYDEDLLTLNSCVDENTNVDEYKDEEIKNSNNITFLNLPNVPYKWNCESLVNSKDDLDDSKDNQHDDQFIYKILEVIPSLATDEEITRMNVPIAVEVHPREEPKSIIAEHILNDVYFETLLNSEELLFELKKETRKIIDKKNDSLEKKQPVSLSTSSYPFKNVDQSPYTSQYNSPYKFESPNRYVSPYPSESPYRYKYSPRTRNESPSKYGYPESPDRYDISYRSRSIFGDSDEFLYENQIQTSLIASTFDDSHCNKLMTLWT